MAEETKKTENKAEEKVWKEFIVPLRRAFGSTSRQQRTPKAIRAIKKFLLRHMKMYDRNPKKIKLDRYLNEFVWTRGIRNPPSKIRIKAMLDGEFVRAELAELGERMKFSKEKLERSLQKGEAAKPKEIPKETPVEQKPEEKTTEEKQEEKEKKAAVVESMEKMEKAAAKQAKHQAKVSKQPKHQRRMALAK